MRRPDALSEFLMSAYHVSEDTARELLAELDQTSLKDLAGMGSNARCGAGGGPVPPPPQKLYG